MSIEVFAEWLRRQGHHVVQTESSYWYDAGPRVYQAFPYHWLIEPSEDELSEFMREHGVVGLRYSTLLDSALGRLSYHAVYEKPSYSLDTLGKWARKNVRRGLQCCSVEPVPLERLATEGWALQLDTLDRQGRQMALEKEDWQRRCLAAAELPGFEAWGTLVNGQLAASVITFLMDDCCYMLYQQSLRQHLGKKVNNALSYVVTETMVSRSSARSILYGLHSLDAPPSVDEFKFRMGYVAKPVRQRVVFHPRLRFLFNSASHTVLRQLLRLQPNHPSLSKAEGLVRFYLEGMRPISEQRWPEPLVRRRLG
jgi:hypothetical protein